MAGQLSVAAASRQQAVVGQRLRPACSGQPFVVGQGLVSGQWSRPTVSGQQLVSRQGPASSGQRLVSGKPAIGQRLQPAASKQRAAVLEEHRHHRPEQQVLGPSSSPPSRQASNVCPTAQPLCCVCLPPHVRACCLMRCATSTLPAGTVCALRARPPLPRTVPTGTAHIWPQPARARTHACCVAQGTPLGDTGIEPPSGLDLVRCIATARVVMPATVVRLSAGRLNLSIADQVLLWGTWSSLQLTVRVCVRVFVCVCTTVCAQADRLLDIDALMVMGVGCRGSWLSGRTNTGNSCAWHARPTDKPRW